MQEEEEEEEEKGKGHAYEEERAAASILCVPFAWEEKPGVPRNQEGSSINTAIFAGLNGIPAKAATSGSRAHPAVVSFALCKPPRLQQREIIDTHNQLQRQLGKTASFSCISAGPVGHQQNSNSKRLVRRVPSLDHIIQGGGRYVSDTLKLNHINITHLTSSGIRRGRAYRVEDDPFSMAILACRKEDQCALMKAAHSYSSTNTSIKLDQRYQVQLTAAPKVRGHVQLPDEEMDQDAHNIKKALQQLLARRLFTCVSSCFSHISHTESHTV